MIYIFVALICYTAALLFVTAAARNLNTNLSTAIINVVSAIVPIVISIPILSKKSLASQRFGVSMAVLAGIMIALYGLAFAKGISINKVGVVAPVVFGGAIFLSTILSYFIFKEKVSQLQLIGLLFLALGFSLVIYARATGR